VALRWAITPTSGRTVWSPSHRSGRGKIENLIHGAAVENVLRVYQSPTCLPQFFKDEREILADPFVGVVRQPLRVTDTLKEEIQDNLLVGHSADVLVIDQAAIDGGELRWHLADA